MEQDAASKILEGLNDAQRAAVVNYDSPSLIIARRLGQDARFDVAHGSYDPQRCVCG